LQDAEASSLAGTSATTSQTSAITPICEKGTMNKEDDELLARLAKESEKEELEFDNREQGLFHRLLEKLIGTTPDKGLKRSSRESQPHRKREEIKS
jgi:hypothetical protein